MNKYLSLVFLYNRASHKKILLIAGIIPLSFLAIFLLRIGNPYEASPYMLMERAFGGVWPVLLLIAVNLMGLISVVSALNGKKDLKATHSTTGYTMRRLGLSPISSCITIFVYYLAITLIFWSVAIASLYAIGKIGLTMAGASGIDTKLALGLLRTEIGHALIPIAHPAVIVFNIVVVLALAGECGKSCYLRWHNGTPSVGAVLVVAPMFFVWMNALEDTFIFIIIPVIALYATFSLGDVIFREKRPKGDPFKVNKYAGIMDLDDFDFDDSAYISEANRPVENDEQSSVPQLFGRVSGFRKFNLFRLRRRFMPLGINMERVNTVFGAWIAIGMVEHSIFLFRYKTHLDQIQSHLKGISIADGMQMPYFWDLQEHSYYGYIVAMLMVLFLQAYWNWGYYNKTTKSVYVMRRLPNRKEYPRTIWVGPIIQAAFIAMIMVLHTVADLCVYLLITPEVAFYTDYLSHILPF